MTVPIIFAVLVYSLMKYDGPTSKKIDWCTLGVGKCGSPNEQIFCKYPNESYAYEQPHSNCYHIRLRPISMTRDYVVIFLNDFRNKWANQEWPNQSNGFPKAANMRVLRWDKELEKAAIQMATHCQSASNCGTLPRDSYSTMSARYPIPDKGAYKDYVSDENALKKLIPILMQGIDKLSPEHVSSLKQGQDQEAFTSLLFSNASLVGCGLSMYFDSAKKLFHKLLVCNVMPKAEVGVPLYAAGVPGSGCSYDNVIGFDPRFPFLCGRSLYPHEIVNEYAKYKLHDGTSEEDVPYRMKYKR